MLYLLLKTNNDRKVLKGRQIAIQTAYHISDNW